MTQKLVSRKHAYDETLEERVARRCWSGENIYVSDVWFWKEVDLLDT